ncbi:MAG TPA: alpha/beta hydrolase [Candidatus Acidoferrales bacterium]|nr:alpha/beta hydrolase [Candidatus Acidoferrales bacterium]
MRVRTYGDSESAARPTVIVVHGGPGAAGSMAPVARALADSFRVLEPFQSPTSDTVAGHVADLHEVVQSHCGSMRPSIVGHSWGAMLALAYAAAHPEMAGPIVLIASGTFDLASRARLEANLDARMDATLRRRFERLSEEFPDPNDRHAALGNLTLQLYSCDLATAETEAEPGDKSAGVESWNDMVRLQNAGVYPQSFAAIKTPVLMLHGDSDPHPGPETRDCLRPYLPQLEYVELARCGHYPWVERSQLGGFFPLLKDWLARNRA